MDSRGRQSLGPRARPQRPAVSFPILKAEEILAALHDLGIEISPEELAKPSASIVRRTFVSFVELLLGVTKEELMQPKFSGLSAFNLPELHEDSVAQLSVYRAASRLMDACGYPNFSIQDLLNPESTRFREQLSGAVNFAKFREDRIEVYERHAAETDEIVEHLQKIQQSIDEHRQRAEELSKQKEAERPRIEALQENITQLEREVGELSKDHGALRHKNSQLRELGTRVGDQVSAATLKALTLKQECERLESQIVRSPERLKKELESLAEGAESEKRDVAAGERRARDLAGRLEMVKRTVQEVRAATDMLREAEAEMAKAKEGSAAVAQRQAAIAEAKAALVEVETRCQHLERQIARHEEKLGSQRRQAEMRTEAADQALAQARAELQQLQRSHSEERVRAEQLAAQVRLLQHAMAEEEAQHKREMAEVKESYEKLLGTVRSYHRVLLANISNQAPAAAAGAAVEAGV